MAICSCTTISYGRPHSCRCVDASKDRPSCSLASVLKQQETPGHRRRIRNSLFPSKVTLHQAMAQANKAWASPAVTPHSSLLTSHVSHLTSRSDIPPSRIPRLDVSNPSLNVLPTVYTNSSPITYYNEPMSGSTDVTKLNETSRIPRDDIDIICPTGLFRAPY